MELKLGIILTFLSPWHTQLGVVIVFQKILTTFMMNKNIKSNQHLGLKIWEWKKIWKSIFQASFETMISFIYYVKPSSQNLFFGQKILLHNKFRTNKKILSFANLQFKLRTLNTLFLFPLFAHFELKKLQLWLRRWIPNPGVLCSKPLGGSKVDSAFHPSEVHKMSTRTFWELSGKK